jgi:uncharacterized protein
MFDFEWDPQKNSANLRKHDVSFADATTALEDIRALTLEDDQPDERRFITMGMDLFGRILVVVYTYRGTKIRIISARKATPSERQQYEADL